MYEPNKKPAGPKINMKARIVTIPNDTINLTFNFSFTSHLSKTHFESKKFNTDYSKINNNCYYYVEYILNKFSLA